MSINTYIKNLKATSQKIELINSFFLTKFNSDNKDDLTEIVKYNQYLITYLNEYIKQINIEKRTDINEEMTYISNNIDVYVVSLASVDVNNLNLLKEISNTIDKNSSMITKCDN